MSPAGKQQLREDRAREAIANWRTCPLRDLQDAAEVFDSALLLLIARYAG